MGFFKGEKIYRVEVTKECPVMGINKLYVSGSYLPSVESLKKGKFGFIPVGIKGWVIKQYGKEYFLPDKGQEGLDLFMPALQEDTLISYNKVKEYCKKI
ncbi:hypothetical protein ACJDT4_06940 [Clostridium neuense]|uniref:Uncharacterized protein n=1 Tax=Clostridium neuense TaxID=1728934 RepID=A0ABW8TGV0_9CLOT